MKFATVTAVLLMIIVCVLLPKLPAIHTWAVEREEERIAEAELAEQKITTVSYTHLDVYKRQDQGIPGTAGYAING